jgi:hypothetical protein
MKNWELWASLRRSLPLKRDNFTPIKPKEDKVIVIEIKASELYEAIVSDDEERERQRSMKSNTKRVLKDVRSKVPERVKRAERLYKAFKALEEAWHGTE